jgi:hypothetical protein
MNLLTKLHRGLIRTSIDLDIELRELLFPGETDGNYLEMLSSYGAEESRDYIDSRYGRNRHRETVVEEKQLFGPIKAEVFKFKEGLRC